MTVPNSTIRRRCHLVALVGVLAAPLLAAPGLAQTWNPVKPIRFIVGFAPGGSADILARVLQGPMAQKLGVPVVVENIAGAGGNIAMSALVRAAPDGQTIVMGFTGSHAINPAIFGDKLPFRVPEDFTPVTQLVAQPNVLIINNSVPARSVAEFIAWIKANPGQHFGSAGIGTSNHLSGELIGLRFGARLVHAPYKGAAQVLTDLMGGHIPMTVDNITTAARLANEGKVRAIAVTTARRSPKLPNVPTFAESGAPDFDLTSWQGLFGPRGLPPEVVARLHEAALFALNDPVVRQNLADFGSEPIGQRPEQFAAFVVQEKKKWGDIVRDAHVKSE